MRKAQSVTKTMEPVNLKAILQTSGPLSTEELSEMRRSMATEQVAASRIEIEALIREVEGNSSSSGAIVRAGVGAHLLGQHAVADRLLSTASGDPLAVYVHGLVLLSLDRPADAEEKFAIAGKAGYDSVECALKRAGAQRLQGKFDAAEQTLKHTGAEGARRADYSYQMGCILSDRGDTYGAIEYFERAVDMDPHHSQALFRLAAENALHGNDVEAIRLYEQCLSKPPYHLGALMNLGLLYEDRGNYTASAFCFRRVLAFDPQNQRAAMYMKDIEASNQMFYDDDSARNEARLAQLLSRPVTDFELSVRSRNCLAGMNILTLGDLTRVSETDLLQGKNFGETSLVEIRELMTAHGLSIGQSAQSSAPATGTRDPGWTASNFFQQLDLTPQEQAQLTRPVADLNLSVRARKCMARLGITTVGELIQRTPDELLATKNFGVTSLNEIRQQLGEVNMKLRND